MKRRKPARGRELDEQGIEWIGGMTSMPAYITGEGEPYRPQMLCWMGADGALLGVVMARPDELAPLIGKSLQDTIERPMHGRPHAPTRVRVASAQLADALRASHPALDIVCAPTPELDAVLALMQAKLGEDAPGVQSYLSPGIEPEAVASFFEAAADLFRAQPWKVVPNDQSLLAVTIEQLGVQGAAMSVIGQMGQSLGFILFSSLTDFIAYVAAAEFAESDEVPKLPPHFALNFERGADLAPALRKEIAAHHWPVAGPMAYPWPVVVDEDLVARPPTLEELTAAEAIARALTKLLARPKPLRAAWRGGKPVARRISVPTHQGEIEVSLCAPYQREPAPRAASARPGATSKRDAGDSLELELLRRLFAVPKLTEAEAPRQVASRQGLERTPKALAYTNRKGVTYYLHEGRTKLGKPRYFFARSIRDGALTKLPTGYEVSESINGVVSVRRLRAGEAAIPEEDLALVRTELERHAHLRHHLVQAERDAIVIYQPDVDFTGFNDALLPFGLLPGRKDACLADRIQRAHFSPVLRFVRDASTYTVLRMTYRGHGGWSHPLASGPLDRLVRKYVRKVGTDAFFELM